MVALPSRRGVTPVFGYAAPHPSGGGTSTLPIKTLPSTHYGDFARFKAAIIECLEQVEGEHRDAIASLLTLKFQTFDNTQLLAA